MKYIQDVIDRGLDDLVLAFSYEMRAKLQQKFRDGYVGWDRGMGYQKDQFKERLIEHVEKGQWIDVANFAAFLWNVGETDEEGGKE